MNTDEHKAFTERADAAINYRNEFTERAQTAHANLLGLMNTRRPGSLDERRLFFKAEAVKEAAAAVQAVFDATPVQTPEDEALTAFRKPVNELVDTAKAALNVYRNHMTTGTADDEIATAEATLAGYRLALDYLYTR